MEVAKQSPHPIRGDFPCLSCSATTENSCTDPAGVLKATINPMNLQTWRCLISLYYHDSYTCCYYAASVLDLCLERANLYSQCVMTNDDRKRCDLTTVFVQCLRSRSNLLLSNKINEPQLFGGINALHEQNRAK